MSGEMVQEFYDATYALKIGEVSRVIASDYGYHIIMRVEPDFNETKIRLTSMAVDNLYNQRLEKATIKLSDGFDNIKLSDFNLP